MLTTRERIITAQKLARQVHVALANAQQEPLVVTESGAPVAYLIGVDLFDKLIERLTNLSDAELKTAVALGEEQLAKGAYKTLDEAEAILEAAWREIEG